MSRRLRLAAWGKANEFCLEVWEMPGAQSWVGAGALGGFSSCFAVKLGVFVFITVLISF